MAIEVQSSHTGVVERTATKPPHVDEVITFCPGCKAFQTLWVNNNKLVLTRKFIQRNNRIYHDCGTDKPCRLYRTIGPEASE